MLTRRRVIKIIDENSFHPPLDLGVNSGLYARHRFGAIAQLVERLHGMQEVSGSIPLSSTNRPSENSRKALGQKLFAVLVSAPQAQIRQKFLRRFF